MTNDPRARTEADPGRAFWETAREISHYEADEAATRLINSHFKNDAERARISIPANPDRDDDLIIRSYIRQQQRLSASPPAPAPEAAGAEALPAGVEADRLLKQLDHCAAKPMRNLETFPMICSDAAREIRRLRALSSAPAQEERS